MVFGLAGKAIVFVTDFRTALALRFLQGAGFAELNPTIMSIGDLYEDDAEATGQGIRFMISGLVVAFAWQYPSFLYLIAFPAALSVFRWFEEPTEESGPDLSSDSNGRSYLRTLYELTRRRVLAILIARALYIVVWFGFLTSNSPL